MTVAAPIYDEKGRVIAALALRVDPRRDFTETTTLARLAESGDTYAFDRNGRLLTEIRFDDELRKAGLIGPDMDSILNVEIRDPGVSIVEGYRPKLPRNEQPFTRMAQSALTGNTGVDLEGYRDYRGVPVVGAWLWDQELNMGLATELDQAEAFAPYRRFRQLVLFLLLLMAGVTVALLLILRHRERLLASNAAFEQAVQAREDMMAIVAHDLKNPLTTLLLRCHVMIQLLAGGAPQNELRRNLESQERSARHMNQIITDLTDVARIQAGRLAVNPEDSTVADALDPAVERVRLLAAEKGIEFVTRLASDLPPILVDRSRITQVLDNLFGNALKFTPKGGRITVEASTAGQIVQVAVSDTGCGIPTDAVPHVFEPYWQVQQRRTGLGLGLYIAKTLVEAHVPFPDFNAVFVSTVEFVCGLLLILGALTPLVCALLACLMIVAIVTTAIHNTKAFSPAEWLAAFLYLPEPLYLVILIWLFFSGPGWLSVDNLLLSQTRF